MPTSIISSRPIWDAIAILILLLNLPPLVATTVQFVFAVMTFIPPSTNAYSSNPTVKEIIRSIGGLAGSMTIPTKLSISFVAFILPYPTPLLHLVFDLAQAVISISLSGSSSTTASPQGSKRSSAFWCISLVILFHAFRWKPLPRLGIESTCRKLAPLGLCEYSHQPADTPDVSNITTPSFSSLVNYNHFGPQPWYKTLLSLNIFGQGCARIVRTYILKLQALEDSSLVARNGPDQTSSSNSTTSSTFGPASNPDSTSGQNSTSSFGKIRFGVVKKKKKTYAQQKKISQPFWAAVAKTKLDLMKEHEELEASLDAQFTQPTSIEHTVGQAIFSPSRDTAWISNVGVYEFSLRVCLPREDNDESVTKSPKTWHVFLTSTEWEAVNKTLIGNIMFGEVEYEIWEGLVTGLAPLGFYTLQVTTSRAVELLSTTVITESEPCAETEQSMNDSSDPTSFSPIATLRISIQALDRDVEKARVKLKAIRKHHKSALDKIQSHIDSAHARVNGGTVANNVEKARQRAMQVEANLIRLAQDEVQILEAIDGLGQVPQEDIEKHENAKRARRDRQSRMDTRRANLAKATKDSEKSIANLNNLLQSVRNKRAKVDGKLKDKESSLLKIEEKLQVSQAANLAAMRAKAQRDYAAQQETAVQKARIDDLDQQFKAEMGRCSKLWAMISDVQARASRPRPVLSAPRTPEYGKTLPLGAPSSSSAAAAANTNTAAAAAVAATVAPSAPAPHMPGYYGPIGDRNIRRNSGEEK